MFWRDTLEESDNRYVEDLEVADSRPVPEADSRRWRNIPIHPVQTQFSYGWEVLHLRNLPLDPGRRIEPPKPGEGFRISGSPKGRV